LPKNDAYSSAEFKAIRAAASQRVNQALRRIEVNSAALRSYADGTGIPESLVIRSEGVAWTRGSLLHYLSQVGMLPSEYLAARVKLKGNSICEEYPTPLKRYFRRLARFIA
jgi:hypothetical protein